MIILGIETSCDETAAARRRGDRRRGAAVARAARTSSRRRWTSTASGAASCPSCRRGSTSATSAASSSARSPTRGVAALRRDCGDAGARASSGRCSSGLRFAKSLAWARGVPLVPVHHLAGHIESLVLEDGEMPLPAVVLVVSGGHTSLYRVPRAGRLRAPRPHARRRGGRGLRQGGQAARASAIRAGRSSIVWPARATTARCRFRRRG